MPGTHSDMCITRIRRNHLVEDALDEIARQYRKDLFKPLRVHFIGEEGIDAGGVKKEFFQLLVAELLTPDYGMLVYQPESNTYWWVQGWVVRVGSQEGGSQWQLCAWCRHDAPYSHGNNRREPPPSPLLCVVLPYPTRFNAISLEGEEQFMLLGLVLGLAIYNRVLLDFPLPLALYKKLLGQPVGLRELEDMQPMLGRSMRKLLEYDGDASVEVGGCGVWVAHTGSGGL
jgi:ubiquitin-protein ligase E3 A